VALSVRATIPHLGAADQTGSLVEQTTSFVAQELEHHKQHRRFNDLLLADEPGLERLDQWMARTFGWLQRRGSDAFNAAFAAGFETVAYTVARWTEQRAGRLMGQADDVAATLFLWHLAEEVEHKRAAWDAYHQAHGSRRTYALAMVTSFLLLAFFTIVNTTFLLWKQRRLLRPVAHWRLLTWSISFLFDLLPAMVVSALPGHHPTHLTDPSFYELWLREFDGDSQTMPVWNRSSAIAA
jgi:predicted metal-dependent hydrolase